MQDQFFGTYRHTLDAKGRLAVPSKVRALLVGGAFVSRWMEQCLALWPREVWADLTTKIRQLPLDNATGRALSRVVFSSADEITFDPQGRFLVPPNLRDLAGLVVDSPAVIVGNNDHAEIWAPDRWDAYQQGLTSPEGLMEHLAGLGL